MTVPNLLIVGSQKCGTTWLHRSLGLSKHIFATAAKELNFFNQANATDPDAFVAFRQNFPPEPLPGVEYYLESTPHYFRLPAIAAQNIRTLLGTPTLLAVFRNPVDRYESAYIHHMMRGRFPYTPEITEFSDELRMLSLGKYGEILERWWEIHPTLQPLLYDDLQADPVSFVRGLMEGLGLECDITPEALAFRTNDKDSKIRALGAEWVRMPMLGAELRRRLSEEYHDDIGTLGRLIGRNLDAWTCDVEAR
jgi:hypothetical protein